MKKKRILLCASLTLTLALSLIMMGQEDILAEQSKIQSTTTKDTFSKIDKISNQDPKEEKLNAELESLPRIGDLNKLSENELHHTPEIILKGASVVGRIHYNAEQSPSKRREAMLFFKNCLEDDNIAIAIRAVCLNKVYKLIPEWEIPISLEEDKISHELKELARELF